MARAMFEYSKSILKKVSFNTVLFCKELDKAMSTKSTFKMLKFI